jgi:Ca2+/Na+ antiporter
MRSIEGDPQSAVVEHTVVGGSVLSSILVFFMWVGAWGSVDIIIQILTDDRLYQLTLYFLLFASCAVASWILMADLRKSQEEEDGSTV